MSEARALGDAITAIDARDVRGYALEAAALTWSGAPNGRHPDRAFGLGAEPGLRPAATRRLARAYVDAQRWPDGLDAGERGLSISGDDADLNRAYALRA